LHWPHRRTTLWQHTGRDRVLEAIARALASGCLVGTYERHDTTIRANEVCWRD
jgi:hypothetical protein